jgi:hypothetical protein
LPHWLSRLRDLAVGIPLFAGSGLLIGLAVVGWSLWIFGVGGLLLSFLSGSLGGLPMLGLWVAVATVPLALAQLIFRVLSHNEEPFGTAHLALSGAIMSGVIIALWHWNLTH